MNFSSHEFDTFFASELNEQQQAAITHINGPLLVVAGAGSGKTRVITTRIVYLILKKDIVPESICALTFTNKAAKEMKERIVQFLGTGSRIPFIGTFHSYCLQFLQKHTAELGINSFSMLDAEDQLQLIQTIMKRGSYDERTTAKSIVYQISQYKNNNTLNAGLNLYPDPLFIELYQAYEQEKKLSKCFDFDDLLLETYKLFTKHAHIRTAFQTSIRHVLIDEYQDTNHIQGALIKIMTQQADGNLAVDSICAVGDEDQSIYSWRGATVENIINFTKTYPHTTNIKIEQNYRSVEPILQVANHVIDHNTYRNPKKLWSEKKAHNRVTLLKCMSNYQEADGITTLLILLCKKKKLRDTALLYRAHYQSRALEEALIKNSIPYKIIGGIQFYERKEIKDLLAYLRLIVNPFDRISFCRVLNVPGRGMGQKAEEFLLETWNTEFLLTAHQLVEHMITQNMLTGVRKVALEEFMAIINPSKINERPSKLLRSIIAQTMYHAYLKKMYDATEAESKIENINELIRAAEHFEEQGITTISRLLDEVALLQEHQTKQTDDLDYVQLMTLHAAKGLEFDTVCIGGLEEGTFPSSRSLVDQQALEEERRLLYVGITRAREHLVLSYGRYRYAFGSMNDHAPSRFIKELPAQFVTTLDCQYWSVPQFSTYFAEWLGIQKSSNVMTFGKKAEPSQPKIEHAPKEKTPAPLAKERITPAERTPWKQFQSVKHESFGIGIIKEVARRPGDSYILTIDFKGDIKKVQDRFVTAV